MVRLVIPVSEEMKIIHRLTGIIAVLLCVVVVPAVYGGGKKASADAARLKSRHYFLSASQKYASGQYDEAYELFRKAYLADTTNGAAALEYGTQYMMLSPFQQEQDTLLRESLLRSGRRLVDEYPSDFYSIYSYVMLNVNSGRAREGIDVMERFRNLNPGHTSGLELLNDLYIDEHEFEKALEVLDSYERIKGTDIKLLLRKSAIYMAMGDSAGAVNVARKYVSDNPSNPQAWQLKGQIEQYLEYNDSALASYARSEALSEPGTGGAAKIQMAQLFRLMGDSTAYDNKVYEALMAEDLNIDIKKELLQYYVSAQVSDSVSSGRSDRLMEVLVRQYPHEPEILALASDYSLFTRNYDKALDEIRYCIDLDPSSMDYRRKALVLAYLANNPEALDTIYSQTVRFFNPLSADFTIEYSRMLSSMDKEEEAIATLQSVMATEYPGIELTAPLNTSALNKNMSIEQLNNLIDIYQVAADTYSQMKTYPEQTQVCYENVLMLNPDDPLMLNNYAYFLVRDKEAPSEENLAKARKMIEQAVKLAPGNPTYMDTHAWVLFRAGEFEEARDIQREAIEKALAEGDDKQTGVMTELYDHYGDILEALGEKKEAMEYWQKALEDDPENADIKLKLKLK